MCFSCDACIIVSYKHIRACRLILWDEIARSGGGSVLGQMGINSMALPPIIRYGSAEMKARVVRDVVQGRKNISLAISEPSAGERCSARGRRVMCCGGVVCMHMHVSVRVCTARVVRLLLCVCVYALRDFTQCFVIAARQGPMSLASRRRPCATATST
jgi:hypothetical protein